MTDKKFIKEYKIPYFLSDRYGRIPVSLLSSILVAISAQQTTSIDDEGKLSNYFKENKLSWIIIHYTMNVNRQPEAGETVTIETYATGYNKLFCYRQFDIYDAERNLIVTTTITYAWLDIQKRKLARMEPEIIEVYGAEYEDRIRRMPAGEFDVDNPDVTGEYEVSYFDIDSNSHVNFSVYIKWAIQSLGVEFLNNHQVVDLSIKYDKEVLEDQTVVVKTNISEDGQHVHTQSKIETDRDNATVEMKWKKK